MISVIRHFDLGRTSPFWTPIGQSLALVMIGFCGFAGRAAGASLHAYDLSTGQEVLALSGHNRPTSAIAISPDGTFALTASLTPELRLWSLPTGREIRSFTQLQLPGYVGEGVSLQFINGTNLALITRKHSGVHLWNLASNSPVLGFKAPFTGVSAAMVSVDQKSVMALSDSEVLAAVWGYPQGELLGAFAEQWMSGYRYVCLARDGKPRSWWESDSGEPWPEGRPAPTVGQPGFGDRALLSPDGRRLVSYGTSITRQNAAWLHLWDIGSGRLLWHHPALDLPMTSFFRSQTCAALAFSPDSQTFAIGSRAGDLRIQDVDGARHRQELKAPPGSCVRIAFLPSGKQLLTWGEKMMRVWDLGRGELIRSFAVPTAQCLAVTPDGRWVLVGGDGAVLGR